MKLVDAYFDKETYEKEKIEKGKFITEKENKNE